MAALPVEHFAVCFKQTDRYRRVLQSNRNAQHRIGRWTIELRLLQVTPIRRENYTVSNFLQFQLLDWYRERIVPSNGWNSHVDALSSASLRPHKSIRCGLFPIHVEPHGLFHLCLLSLPASYVHVQLCVRD